MRATMKLTVRFVPSSQNSLTVRVRMFLREAPTYYINSAVFCLQTAFICFLRTLLDQTAVISLYTLLVFVMGIWVFTMS